MLFWLGTSPATLVHCYAARCCSRHACTYSGGDPEHCLIPISSCCGSRPSKAAISLRALVPIREVVFDSTVTSKNFVQSFTPHFCGVLLLRIFAEYFYSAFLRSNPLFHRPVEPKAASSPRFSCFTRTQPVSARPTAERWHRARGCLLNRVVSGVV